MAALPLARPERWIHGEIIDYTDMQDLSTWSRMKDGMLAYGLTGVNAFLPTESGLSCVPGTGLQVLVGPSSGSQLIFLPSTTADNTNPTVGATSPLVAFPAYVNSPQTTLAVASVTTSGHSRIDIVCVRFKAIDVNPHTVNVNVSGTITPMTVYNVEDTIDTPIIVTGTEGASPTPPSPPDGTWTVLAQITTAFGDTSISTDAITIELPTFDRVIREYVTGFTVTTALITVPVETFSVVVPVNDTSVWAVSDIAYIVGPHSGNAFVGLITAVDPVLLTITFTNLNTTINGSGTLVKGGYVLPAGIAPVCVSTAVITVPPIGLSGLGGAYNVDIPCSNSGAFTPGNYGIITGPLHDKGFYFVVNTNSGDSINVSNIGLAQGGHSLISSTLLTGSQMNPCGAPGLMEEDQDNGGFMNPTQATRGKKGTVTIGSVGGSFPVSFNSDASYSGANTYSIKLTPLSASLDPYPSSRGAGGFTINLGGTGTGDVEWSTEGC